VFGGPVFARRIDRLQDDKKGMIGLGIELVL
jgi:hypothetical protein